MTLLHGNGGFIGKRPRIDRQRSPDPDSGPLLRTVPAVAPLPGLSLELGPTIHSGPTVQFELDVEGPRRTTARVGGKRPASLDAALARLASAGPTPADVLEILVIDAAALLDAPARLAVAAGDRLVWSASCGDPSTPIGLEADSDRTACGTAWRTGQIQHVSDSAMTGDDGFEGEGEGEGEGVEGEGIESASPELSTRCCGSPAALLVVPLLRPGRRVARHADPVREVIAVLALIADRPAWFDDADIEVAADLAEVAGERIAALQSALRSTEDPTSRFPGGPRRELMLAAEPESAEPESAEPQSAEPESADPAPEPALLQPAMQPALHTVPEPEEQPDDAAQADFDGWFDPATPTPTSLPTAPVPRLLAALRQRSRPERAAKPAPARTEPSSSPASPASPASQATASGGLLMPPAMPAPDSMGLWQWDAVERTFAWSSPVARLLGLDPDAQLTLDVVREAVVAADRSRFDVAVRAIGSGRGVAGALRLKTPDSRAKHAYAWSEVRRDEAGSVIGAWGGVVDVTAFEHDVAALRSGLAGLRAAQELTGLATWEWRPATDELIWSDEMYRLVGVSAEEFSPTPDRWHAFIHPDDLDRARRLDLAADGQDGDRVETFRLIGPGGEVRHVQSWSAPSRGTTSSDRSVSNADARVIYGATIDVTRQVHDRMMLERLSATDPVTGLGNRLAYDRRMKELLAAAPSAGPAGAVTLILLDLDRFKVVNDSLGHQVGDRLLIEVARRLVAVVPEGSVTARMGGDEFVVVPPVGAGDPDIRRLAIGIVDALRAPYVLPETGEMLVCPASLGIATTGGRRVSSHDLLREADIALYRAKDSGRDRFVIFDEVLKARTQVRQRAERQLREALETDRLVMEYQPVVDFTNGRIVGAEGLVRLQDAEVGDRLIAPELFLDIAEQTGLVVEVDTWVIETAIRQLAEWGEQAGSLSDPPWLAINLSARSMEHPRVVRRLIEAVKRGEVPRDRIKIELTEHSFIGALPGVEVALRQLMANGIGVGIDDFGTGYSALAYLHHFDLDFMKIDRSFVSSVGEGQRGDAVVTAIVDLAHAHGMRVIAEGVESGRQARRLREMGCDFAQGFHFGRPGEAARIVRG